MTVSVSHVSIRRRNSHVTVVINVATVVVSAATATATAFAIVMAIVIETSMVGKPLSSAQHRHKDANTIQ